MKLIIANWKMYLRIREQVSLAKQLARLRFDHAHVRVVVCPSLVALQAVSPFIKRPFALGAQDVFWEERGPFTGEISPQDLTDLGCRYVIVGHSERRQYLNELDAMVRKKIKAALIAHLIPIVCVGETLAERNSGHAVERVREQLHDAFKGLTVPELSRIIIAYEPIWAIGTGQPIIPREAEEMHLRILETVARIASGASPQAVVYGGSIDAKNVASFVSLPSVGGCLVGGASTSFDTFRKIVYGI